MIEKKETIHQEEETGISEFPAPEKISTVPTPAHPSKIEEIEKLSPSPIEEEILRRWRELGTGSQNKEESREAAPGISSAPEAALQSIKRFTLGRDETQQEQAALLEEMVDKAKEG